LVDSGILKKDSDAIGHFKFIGFGKKYFNTILPEIQNIHMGKKEHFSGKSPQGFRPFLKATRQWAGKMVVIGCIVVEKIIIRSNAINNCR